MVNDKNKLVIIDHQKDKEIEEIEIESFALMEQSISPLLWDE
jgi:hypothetical protein